MSIKYIQDDNGNFYTDANGNLLTVDVSGEGGGQMLYRHDIVIGEGSDLYYIGITIINASSENIDTIEKVKNAVGIGKTIIATGSYGGPSYTSISISFEEEHFIISYDKAMESVLDYANADVFITDSISEIGVASGGSTTSLFSEWTTGTSGNLYLPSAGLYEIKVVVLEYNEPRTMTFFVNWEVSSYSYSQATLYEVKGNDSSSIIIVDDTGLIEYYNNDYNSDKVQSISYRKVNEQISAGGSSNSGGSGSSSSNDGMPTIRLVTVRDTDGSMVISVDNPLTFTVEITSGSLQVGDQLQICSKELYTYRGCSQKRYKLRRFAEYVVAESDLDKTTLYLTIAGANSKHPNLEIERLCRGGGINQSCRRYPKYIRLRRTLYHKDNGEEWSASFSNAIQLNVYGRYDRDNESTNGNISIR